MNERIQLVQRIVLQYRLNVKRKSWVMARIACCKLPRLWGLRILGS